MAGPIRRPHLLGIDDGPFDRRSDADVPLVAVLTEGPDLVEAVAVTRFPVDGDDVTGFLADWISEQRFHPALHGVVLGGITVAGLGVVDLNALSRRTGVPALAVNRQAPEDAPLLQALDSAGLGDRGAIVRDSPPARRIADGLWLATSGCDERDAAEWVLASRGKSNLPEPLRLAHLVAAALMRGASRGRP